MEHIFVNGDAAGSGTLYVSADTFVLQLGTEEELTVTRERTLINNAAEGFVWRQPSLDMISTSCRSRMDARCIGPESRARHRHH